MQDSDRAKAYYEAALDEYRADHADRAAQLLARALAANPAFAQDGEFRLFAATVLKLPAGDAIAAIQGKGAKPRTTTKSAAQVPRSMPLLVKSFVVVFVIVGLTTGLWTGTRWINYVRLGQNGITINAVIADRSTDTADDANNQPQTLYHIKYTFRIAEQDYSGTAVVDKPVYDASEVGILYDQTDPTISTLAGDTERSKQLTINVLGTLLMLVCFVFAYGIYRFGESRVRSA